GRNEDPPFTLKTMIVEAYWPGATIDETLQQVTERIEKKLQEVPDIDFVRGYTAAGKSTTFEPQGLHTAARCSRHLVSSSEKNRRYPPYAPPGRHRARLQ